MMSLYQECFENAREPVSSNNLMPTCHSNNVPFVSQSTDCSRIMDNYIDFSDQNGFATAIGIPFDSKDSTQNRGDMRLVDNLKAIRNKSIKVIQSEGGKTKLSREERRRLRRATAKYRLAHATRERIRVEAFNLAFSQLRHLLPTLPPDKKLSKIEILRLAICYIGYLNNVLDANA
ncbi:Helix-loop-helix protein 1 [Sarcoptes scabiei]|uniref:Helix-loop-helix protein 1 n=2 Tax=Sarcoptes scabiei TaxID=52283 RepID=A0A834R9N8_SARSC|nr:Helix-loop-helix protein 1 [Sarcoptes scabiei]